MIRRWHVVIAAFGLAGCLISAPPAHAAAPRVNDEAKIFSPAAVDKANEDIAEMSRRFKKDLVIETFAKAPEKWAAELAKAKTAEERSRAYVRWQAELTRAKRLTGVHVLLCMSPKHVHVWVGQETSKDSFTLLDRDKLREQLVDKLKQEKYDEALEATTTFVHDKFSRKAGAGVVSRDEAVKESAVPARDAGGGGSIWRTVFWIVVVVAGAWIAIALLRAIFGAFSGGGSQAGAPAHGYGGGGGGFFTGLFGGLFGAMAGNWIYNHFFGGPSASSWGSSAAYGGDASAATGDDGIGSSAGDDFGDETAGTGGDFATDGGGDFGGGDFGGGDFGGGDFGGGGDF
jgi:uncharacterized protein